MENKIPKWIVITLLIVAAFGFFESTYLTAKHFTDALPQCSIFGSNCEQVLTSKYAIIFGVPIALPGALYYVAVFLLTIFYRETESKKLIKLLALFTTLGFLVSLFLIYLQIFVIKATCIFCIGSALSSTVLFVLSLYALKLNKRSAIANTQEI